MSATIIPTMLPGARLEQAHCSRCGSTDVSMDAVVRWDVQTQDWVVSGMYDNVSCDNCGSDKTDVEYLAVGP